MSATELILGVLSIVLGGGSIWNWVASRGKTRVDLIQLGQTISAQIIQGLKAERDELAAKVEALEGKVSDLNHSINGLSQHIVSLEELLIRAGITPPPRPERKGKA